jgi:hypothetical protein
MSGPWRGGGLVGLPRTCDDLLKVGYEWYYNWSPTPSCATAGAVPFVPMVKSGFRTLPPSLSVNPGALLTFNEPDAAGMTVQRALDLWPQLEATGRKLSSPAVTQTARGWSWLQAFMIAAERNDLRVDFIAAHWYGSDPRPLVTYLNVIHAKYGLPVWLTEFCVYGGSLAANTKFAEEVGPMLAVLPFLSRVGWFCNRSFPGSIGYDQNGLVDPSGKLTPVGIAYKAWQK